MSDKIPAVCTDPKGDCFECDKALQCYPYSKREELQAKIKLAEQGIARLERQKYLLECELKKLL